MACDQYHLGSNTKAMTAVLIAKYIEEGKLSWNWTLARVLPQWRERMKLPYQNVTIAQLASHHSGFTDAAALKWVQDSGIDPKEGAAAQNNASAVDGRLLFVEQAFNVTPTSLPVQ
ncbi:hypothetical protein EJ08DRAFT_695391 [Tothia fuscella]|uniref:Beta-lactamase-related domain-containing protein n=1 Tax=Tothia fuscella TaxID=1048955 RepID=A0A9P4U150_9PEZI|nr:hypothetical protein EJ08DRAFT_695391 [Tothia fuscella]